MAGLVRHAEERHARQTGSCCAIVTVGRSPTGATTACGSASASTCPGSAPSRSATHWIRHTTLTWVERNFGFAIAHAYAGHTDGAGDTGTATSTYARATLTEVAAALAALTSEPHPLAEPEGGQHDSDS